MRKIAAVVMALMLMAGVCYASDTISKTVYSYPVRNMLGIRRISIVPTTSIRPKVDKIIGYSIRSTNGSKSETYIGIFDGTNNSLSGEVFAESETATTYGMSELWSFGKYIFSGVVLCQGANTQAVIYFVRE